VPLLGVLPGTGGLTRLVDKRKVRRDLADLFCTTAEGVRADRAQAWKLVDHVARPQQFPEAVRARALALAAQSDRPGGAGVALTPLERRADAGGYRYATVQVQIDPGARTAQITVAGPDDAPPASPEAALALGATWWPLRLARELDDAILMLRHNHLDIGLWILRTRGAIDRLLATDAFLREHAAHWFVRETLGALRRTLARLDVSSRSLFAVADADSCFAGTLAELLLAADRSFMLQLPEGDKHAPRVALSELNFGAYPMVSGATRIAARFCEDPEPVEAARQTIGERLDAHDAAALGLVTSTPDDLDWDDEIRIALEERASLSPDALTGMEASLRFAGHENLATRVFGRLSAWQNWIFNRPNAVGEQGALKVYGTGAKAKFNWERV
jgi:benzoyl-CoA-dihydrodiol lyase